MNYNIIMATDKYGGYAKDNRIPWKIPNELKYFNSITTYNEGLLEPIIIMGRKTWDSLPSKPLPNRINIILSKILDPDEIEDGYVFSNWKTLQQFLLSEFYYNEKYIIGGHNIINDFLDNNKDLVKRIYISQINENYECDKFLNISDHLLNYNCMTYSKSMHDRIKNKEVNVLLKKHYLKNIEFPDYDIFYIENNKTKLLRIYETDTKESIIRRQKLPNRITNIFNNEKPYNTMYHGKLI
jgi:dihydrofolate reductase